MKDPIVDCIESLHIEVESEITKQQEKLEAFFEQNPKEKARRQCRMSQYEGIVQILKKVRKFSTIDDLKEI